MEYEDSRNALFCEPNAYVQNFNRKETPKKIVFSEPYECAPNFYINNNFKKRDCECVKKDKHEHCACNKKEEKPNCNCNNQIKGNKNFLSGFNLQSVLPMLGLFNKSGKGGLDLANIMSLLGGKGENNILTNLLGNKDMLSNITSMFTAKKEQVDAKKIKPTEIDIKHYTRVE